MDKATGRPQPQAKGSKGGRSTERRGSNLDKLTVTRTVVVEVEAPAGSRRNGYEDIVVQDVVLNPSVTRDPRERWETPDGETLAAPLDPGIIGGYGPHLRRLVLMLHFQSHARGGAGTRFGVCAVAEFGVCAVAELQKMSLSPLKCLGPRRK
jgi:hypothetical protein